MSTKVRDPHQKAQSIDLTEVRISKVAVNILESILRVLAGLSLDIQLPLSFVQYMVTHRPRKRPPFPTLTTSTRLSSCHIMPITYYIVSFEVPFGFGDNAELNHDPKSWRAGTKPFLRIDLVLYVLPIPDFTTTSGIYFATEALARKLERLGGLRKRDFTLQFDKQMEELGEFEGKRLSDLVCFEVDGKLGADDFVHLEGEPHLLVSEKALSVLQAFHLGNLCTVEPFTAEK